MEARVGALEKERDGAVEKVRHAEEASRVSLVEAAKRAAEKENGGGRGTGI